MFAEWVGGDGGDGGGGAGTARRVPQDRHPLNTRKDGRPCTILSGRSTSFI